MRFKCLVDGELSQGRKGGETSPYALRYTIRIPLLPQEYPFYKDTPMVQKV